MVLERDGVCRNSHLSPKGHARHTRHADHTTTNLQVKAPSADLSGSLPDRAVRDFLRPQVQAPVSAVATKVRRLGRRVMPVSAE